MPEWMTTIDSFTAGEVVRARHPALSGVNPKNLALTLAAASSIARPGLSRSHTAIAVRRLRGHRVAHGRRAGDLLPRWRPDTPAAPLASIKEFMSDHNAVIMMVVLLVLGAKLIGNGLAGLTN